MSRFVPDLPQETKGCSPQELVDALREKIAVLQQRGGSGKEFVSSGAKALDGLLAGKGFRRGSLIEWLQAGDAGGGEMLAMIAAREASRDGGVIVVFDRCGEFYPPAAAHLGIAMEQLLVVHAQNEADNLWALDQALRCRAVAAGVAWPEHLDDRTFRRLQLAAEESGALGLLVRPEKAVSDPSWAEVRLWVEPISEALPEERHFRVTVLRSHGTQEGQSVKLVIDDETHHVHRARRVASPTAYRRSAGA